MPHKYGYKNFNNIPKYMKFVGYENPRFIVTRYVGKEKRHYKYVVKCKLCDERRSAYKANIERNDVCCYTDKCPNGRKG